MLQGSPKKQDVVKNQKVPVGKVSSEQPSSLAGRPISADTLKHFTVNGVKHPATKALEQSVLKTPGRRRRRRVQTQVIFFYR